jgi:hypothetical protein
MEKRIISQGPKGRESYTITLPKEWIKEIGIDKTKLADLEIVGNKVIISELGLKEEKITINADEYKDSLTKILPAFYRMGIKEINFLTRNGKLIEESSTIINEKLIGYEIVDHKKEGITIKYITKESERDFKIILRRIFLLLISFSEVKSQSNLIHKNIGRLYNYCQRILIKKGHTEFNKAPFYYLLLDQLEKISDELNWILNIKLSKKEEQNLNEIFDLLQNAHDIFYKFKVDVYNKNQSRSFKIKEEIKLENPIKISTIHLHNLARILNSIYGTIFLIKSENF